MQEYSHSQIKKTIYLFLSLLLGVFIFLILHRLVIFFLIILSLSSSHLGFVVTSYRQFLILDYSTLLLNVILGSWYGLWLGGYWYEKVYEQGMHGGAFGYLATKLRWMSQRQGRLRNKVEKISHELSQEKWQFEDLAKSLPQNTITVKTPAKRVVKKRTPNKKYDI